MGEVKHILPIFDALWKDLELLTSNPSTQSIAIVGTTVGQRLFTFWGDREEVREALAAAQWEIEKRIFGIEE